MILLAAIYYLAVSGPFGDGSSAQAPIDCSTATKFDTFMRGRYMAKEANDTFRLGPGTFYTCRHRDITVSGIGGKQWNGGDYNWANWNLLANWKFFGAGMNKTIVKLLPQTFYPSDGQWNNNVKGYAGPLSATARCAYGGTVFFGEPWDLPGQEIHDLTVDCSWSDFGCRVTQAWNVPAAGSRVIVTVEDGKKFRRGKYVVLHHTAAAVHDRRKSIGTFEISAIRGNRVTLINRQDLMREDADPWKFDHPGTHVPAGCLIAPRQNTCGINISGNGCKIINVRVTNTGTPIYESANAIGFDMGNVMNGTGAYCQVNNNVVDTTWCTCGWGISTQVNNYGNHPKARVIGEVSNNSFFGNGYDRGGIGNADVTYRGNYYKNCVLYCDTGFTTSVLFENNLIDGGNLGFLSGYKNPDGSPGFDGWTIRNNTIRLLIGDSAFWSLGGLKNWKIVDNDFSVHPDFATWGSRYKNRALSFQKKYGELVNIEVQGNREHGFTGDDIGLDLCITKPVVAGQSAR